MGHADHEQGHRLYLIKSPVVGEVASLYGSVLQPSESRGDLEGLGYRDIDFYDCPEFEKHEEATHSELFYDLFFAANLTVFSEVHDVTNVSELTSYVGYFCTLWFTWALVGLFDVRFVTDSIFERFARAVHLGVMVGFAVVAANFDPAEQIGATFKAMCVILMVSRITLVIQYTTVAWHVRRFRKTHLPLAMMVGLNLAVALTYLGISFANTEKTSYVYVAWYIIGAAELILTAVLSLFWKVLSFEGTHLINRMSLLTLIIIGEGIIVICNNITKIVKNADSWTSPTIGTVTAAIATLYVAYMIYFDWMRHLHLPRYRQLIWGVLHFPFHLSLTLFVEGTAQFVIWYKIQEVVNWFGNFMISAVESLKNSGNVTASTFLETVNNTVQHVFELYPSKWADTTIAVDDALAVLANVSGTVIEKNLSHDDPAMIEFYEAVETLMESISNSLLASFDIEGFTAASEHGFNGTEKTLQEEVFTEDAERLHTVFYYAFIAAGIVLFLMNILYLVSRTKRLTPFNYFRAVLNTLIAMGLCLIALINRNEEQAEAYQSTPWILPTICLAYFVVLLVNHLPHPPPIFFRRGAKASPSERTAFMVDQERKQSDNESGPGSYGGIQGEKAARHSVAGSLS